MTYLHLGIKILSFHYRSTSRKLGLQPYPPLMRAAETLLYGDIIDAILSLNTFYLGTNMQEIL